MGMSSMGRRFLPLTCDEVDAFTGWRHLYCYLTRAGVKADIKRKYRRRERHEAKRNLRKGE